MGVAIKIILLLAVVFLVAIIGCSSDVDGSVAGEAVNLAHSGSVEDNITEEPELEEAVNGLCAPQWKCVSSRFKAYQSVDCNFTQKTECRLGCEDGACRPAPICKREFKCKTENVKALQTENCLWVGEVKCKAGCVDGKCNPESEINGTENLTEEIDELVGEEVAAEPAEEIFHLNFAEEVTIKLNGVDYIIQAYNIESGRVKLKVNGVASDWIYEGGNVMMAEGNVFIVVKEVLFQAYLGGMQKVGFTVS